MRRRLLSMLAAVVVTVGASTLGAPPAAAATWTVSPGGPFTGTAGSVVFTDVVTGIRLQCTASTVSGQLSSGTGLSGTGLFSATFGFSGCGGPLGLTISITPCAIPIFNAESYSNGVTTGTVTNICLRFSSPSCAFTVAGSASWTYTNSTGVLRIFGPGTLISSVSGCFGLVRNGDTMSIDAIFVLRPPPVITSP